MHELNIYCAAMKLPIEQREHFIQAACIRIRNFYKKSVSCSRSRPADLAKPLAVPQAACKTLQTRIENNILIAHLAEARILDTERINEIGADLLNLVKRCPGGKIVLNFNTVTFMSSAMLSKIISLNNECRNAQIELRLCNISPSIMKVFELMKLNTSLNICKTEEKAIASFDKAQPFWITKGDRQLTGCGRGLIGVLR